LNAPRYLVLIGLGLAIISWGLPAAHRMDSPKNLLPSLAVIIGVLMIIAGALLTVLPRFFLE
jgi:hypothetical protein